MKRIRPEEIRLIGVHGPLNGGKDTAANIIQDLLPNRYNRYAFARPIKEACQVLFGFKPEQLEDRVLKETVDPYWGFTPRRTMQLLGTEFARNMLRDDVWIKRAERECLSNAAAGRGTIITDVRFPNEAEWIRSRDDAVIIHLEVPGLEKDDRYKHASEAGIPFDPARDLKVVNDKALGLQAFRESLQALFE
jgi:hypothetical protein